MHLLHRLRNIWKLSEIEPSQERTWEFHSENGVVKSGKPIVKMAQIIKRKTPVDNFLENDK